MSGFTANAGLELDRFLLGILAIREQGSVFSSGAVCSTLLAATSPIPSSEPRVILTSSVEHVDRTKRPWFPRCS